MKKITHLTTALFLLFAGWNQASAQSISGQEKALKATDITAGKVIAFKGISETNTQWINWGSTSSTALFNSGIYTVEEGTAENTFILKRNSDGQYIAKGEAYPANQGGYKLIYVSDPSQAAAFTISQPALNDQNAEGGVSGIHEVRLPDMTGELNAQMTTEEKTKVLKTSWAYDYQVRFTTEGTYLNIQTAGTGIPKYASGKGSWSIVMVYDAKDYVAPKEVALTLKLQNEKGAEIESRQINTYVGGSVNIPTLEFRSLTNVKNGTEDVALGANQTFTVTDGMSEIVCTYKDALTFKPTTISNGQFAEGTEWYQLSIHNTGNRAYFKYDAEKGIVVPIKSGDLSFYDDTQLWCFTGSVDEGVKVYNKAAGSSVCMTYNTNDVAMAEASDKSVWTLKKTKSTTAGFENAFCLRNSNTYVNYNSTQNKIAYWQDNDDGSAIIAWSFSDHVTSALASMRSNTNLPEGTIGTPKAGFGPALAAIEAFEANPNQETENAVYTALNNDPIPFSANSYYRIMTKGRGNQHYMTTGTTKMTGSLLNNANASQVWKFAADGDSYKLTSQDVYTNTPAQSVSVTTTNDENAAQAFVLQPRTDSYAQYAIKPNVENGFELHLGAGLDIVGWNGGGASSWYLIPATSIEASISEAGYATVNYPFAVQVPAEVTAYIGIANTEEKAIVLQEIENGIIPANTPVVLAGAAKTYSLNILADNTDAPIEKNSLSGINLGQTIDASTNAYILGNGDSGIGFYQMSADDRTLSANKAYLELPAALSNIRSIVIGGPTTGIEENVAETTETEEYYDLQGRRVQNPIKGIYVTKSGKKVLFNK